MGMLFHSGESVGERGIHEVMDSGRRPGRCNSYENNFPLKVLGRAFFPKRTSTEE